MKELTERLYTPKEVSELGVLSLAKQWQERKTARLHCYRLGRKILYGQKHLDAYFALCESNSMEDDNLRDVA